MKGKLKRVTIKPGTTGTGVSNYGDGEHLEQGETYDVDEDFAAILVAENRASFADKGTPTAAEKLGKAGKGKRDE